MVCLLEHTLGRELDTLAFLHSRCREVPYRRTVRALKLQASGPSRHRRAVAIGRNLDTGLHDRYHSLLHTPVTCAFDLCENRPFFLPVKQI